MRTTEDQDNYSPDGLDEASIDLLIAEVDDELANLPAATPALLDGTAWNRRTRREIERTLGGTVRVLHIQARTSVPFGTEAA